MKKVLLLLAAINATALTSQAVTLDFNGGLSTDWTDQFTSSTGTALTTNWNWSGSAGIGGTGALTAVSGSNPSLVYETGFSNSTLNISAFVYSNAVGLNTGNSGAFHLGFTDTVTSASTVTGNSASPVDLFALRIQGAGATAGNVSWQVRTDTNSTNGANATLSNTSGTQTFVMAASTWYKVSATFTKGATNTWDFTADITSFGANGTVQGSSLSSFSGTFTDAGTYAASTLYPIISWRNQAAGANTPAQLTELDNLQITAGAIPEPSSFAALAGLGAVAFVGMRRRRQA